MKRFEVAGYDMPCVDLAVNVDVFPKPNGGTGVRAMSWQGGGKVASGMVACARLGAKCAMMGAVGSDDYGQFCIRDFERHGIDVSGMEGAGGGDHLPVHRAQRPGDRRQEHRVPAGHGPAPSFAELDEGILEDCQWFFVAHMTAARWRPCTTPRRRGPRSLWMRTASPRR